MKEHEKESTKPGGPSEEHRGHAAELNDTKDDQHQDAPAVQGNGADPVGQEDAFLASIALRQDYAETVGVEKVLITVPFRKPNKDEFFRVHPSRQYQFDVTLVEFKTERELFVVTEVVESAFIELVTPARLFMCVNRQGVTFIWPVKLPTGDRRNDAWRVSAFETAKLAETHWTRVHADMSLGAYQPFKARADLGEPQWRTESFSAILKLALKDHVVDSLDHPAVKQHLGLT